MDIVLAFTLTLLLSILLSDLARRTVLSATVVFLLIGILSTSFGWIRVSLEDQSLQLLSELALVSVLFTDGAKIGLQDLRKAWHLPGRALAFGMPMTMLGTAVLAHFLVRLSWPEAFLIGTILSPTDPVFAAALVGNKNIPWRVRHLLNVESGLNDGLALPIVLSLIYYLQRSPPHFGELFLNILFGIVIGFFIPWTIILLERSKFFQAAPSYRPLLGFTILLLTYVVARKLKANEFLASFTAGISMATLSSEIKEQFHAFGEQLAELLKLAALFLFGALMSWRFLHEAPIAAYLLGFLCILVVRPISLEIALFRSRLPRKEKMAALWFGPRGFASIVFGLMILRFRIPNAELLFHVVGVSVIISMIVHSSSDVPFANWLNARSKQEPDLRVVG